jgi:RNA polymerase sigma factor (sigma-70 family)
MINEKLVCIVDDDLEVRDSLSLMLGLKGFDCRTYSSGTAFLSAPPSRPCCLVLDLKMGEMDGLSLQEKIIERHLPVEIIFLTAFADVDVMRTAFLNSAVDFLEKPVLIDQILNALEKAYSRLKLKEDSRQVETLQESLTPREKEIFRVVAQGLTHREIGELLGISPRTVEVHKGRVMEKLGVTTMAELIKLSLKQNQA